MSNTPEQLGQRDVLRTFAIDDMTIRSDGDGRTVEAYAAAFSVRAEIRDQDGHYNEELSPGSFTKTINDNGRNVGVFYNHARTIYGTPDGALSVPIGVPIEAPRQDERGVFTVTRYLDNPLADSILNGIKEGAIRAQSFGGKFIRSTRTPAIGRGSLPVITRHEVAMREYGPTPFPAYVGAEILGTRSVTAFLAEVENLDPEDVERLRHMLGLATPLTAPAQTIGTPSGAARTTSTSEPPTGHSARHSVIKLRARARREGGPLA